MEHDQARRIVLAALATVAPEVEPGAIDATAELQEAIDLDSIDFLNLVTAVSDTLGRDIPERDYAELVTLDGFVAYVARGEVEAVT